MTSTSILFVLLCLLIINQEGLGYVRRNLNNDLSDGLDNEQREVLSQRRYWGDNNNVQRDYTQSSFEVYYNGYKVNDASPSSFQNLGDGYAKDTWNAYYRGQKIADASSSSFRVLGKGYAQDTWNKYYMGQKVSGGSFSSFSSFRRKL